MVRGFLSAGVLAAGLLAVPAFADDPREGPAERAGEQVDKAGHEAKQEAQQSASAVDNWASDTKERFRESKRELKETTGLNTLRVQGTAGVAAFTGGLGGLTGTGPIYGVSAGGSWSDIIGFEGGYEGSRTPLDSAVSPVGGALWRHDLFALAKAGLPLGIFRPFVGAGLGVSYINANDEADGPYQNDFLGEIPLALGLEVNRGALTAGLRGTYRVMFFDEFAKPAAGGQEPGGGLMSGELTVGARF